MSWQLEGGLLETSHTFALVREMGGAAAYVTEARTYMSCNRVKAFRELIYR